MKKAESGITIFLILLILLYIFGCNHSPSCKQLIDTEFDTSVPLQEDQEGSYSVTQIDQTNNDVIEWVDKISIGSLACDINAEIKVKEAAPLVEVKLDPFTKEEIQNLINYFLPNQICVREFPFNDVVPLRSGEEVFLQYDENFFGIKIDADVIVQLENWIIRGDAYPGEPKGTTLENINISKDDAILIANKAIKDLEITNCTLSNVSKARLLNEQNITTSEGWYISYVLTASGETPFDTAYTSGCGDMTFPRGSSSKTPWSQQRLDFYIDENGIRYFRFVNRVRLINYSEMPLLPIGDIQTAIKKYIKEGYSHFNLTEDIDRPYVTDIFLSSCLCSSNISDDVAIITPVWIAIISNKYYEENSYDPFFIAVNALNGNREDVVYWG